MAIDSSDYSFGSRAPEPAPQALPPPTLQWSDPSELPVVHSKPGKGYYCMALLLLLIGTGFYALAATSTYFTAHAFARYEDKTFFAVLGCPLPLASIPLVAVTLMAGGIATNSPNWACVGAVLELLQLVVQVLFAVPFFLAALIEVSGGAIWFIIFPLLYLVYMVTEAVFVAHTVGLTHRIPSSWKFV